jgi:hypothetical protein
MGRVKVKPLKWRLDEPNTPYVYWLATTPIGGISVYKTSNRDAYEYSWANGTRHTAGFATADEAKAAAEKRYTDMILKCLEVPDEG